MAVSRGKLSMDVTPYEYVAILQLEQKKQRKEISKCKSELLGKSRNQSWNIYLE